MAAPPDQPLPKPSSPRSHNVIGVVGCGYWGPNLIRNFRNLEGCRMKTMCDLDLNRLAHLKKLYPDIAVESEYDALVEDTEITAIAIATAVNQHYEIAKKALLAGKHVFIEKPMASSSQQCEELNAIAHERGLIVMVGHIFLYTSAVKKIKELVEQGSIGDIRYISCRRLNLGLFRNDTNVTWDLAPHDISIILHVMGEAPISVNCQGTCHVTAGVQDVTTLTLRFSGDRSAIIQSSWLDPRKVRETTIVGSNRMIVYDDVEPQEKIKIFDSRVENPPHYDTFGEFQYAYHYGDKHIPYLQQDEPLKAELQHFLDCIARKMQPLTNGINGRQVVQVLEASTESLKNNGAAVSLTLDEAAER